MHILLLSTSDRRGSLILQSALSRNYTVTILTPQTSHAFYHASVTFTTGSPTAQHDLEAALQTPTSPEAIVLAFDQVDVLEMATRALLSAVKSVHRGTHETVKAPCSDTTLPLRLVFSCCDAAHIGLDDYNRIDAIVRESGLPFVAAQWPRLPQESIETIRASPGDGRGAAWLAAVKREPFHVAQETRSSRKTWSDKAS
ncbi:hypothetical protein FHETE_8540 [Fusarium heterosporum]|uniref:Uncharacterized protein n=1 Tax=Fusarium heterosporum TaxID=42747 RepID=A0A8H5WIJ4_FUSHE|nr:hypothetical protein FHETE_8540 [Fusarium heterosporum]